MELACVFLIRGHGVNIRSIFSVISEYSSYSSPLYFTETNINVTPSKDIDKIRDG